jgi:hypothetical protein
VKISLLVKMDVVSIRAGNVIMIMIVGTDQMKESSVILSTRLVHRKSSLARISSVSEINTGELLKYFFKSCN